MVCSLYFRLSRFAQEPAFVLFLRELLSSISLDLTSYRCVFPQGIRGDGRCEAMPAIHANFSYCVTADPPAAAAPAPAPSLASAPPAPAAPAAPPAPPAPPAATAIAALCVVNFLRN